VKDAKRITVKSRSVDDKGRKCCKTQWAPLAKKPDGCQDQLRLRATHQNSELLPSPFTSSTSSFPPLPPPLSTLTTYELYYLVCVSGFLSAPVPVVLVLFLFCEGASDSFYHSNPSSLTRNPCDAHRDLSSNSVSFISHIFSTPCPKFKTDRLRAAEYPPGVAVAASAPEVVVVVAADLRMPTTQTPHHLKRVKLVR